MTIREYIAQAIESKKAVTIKYVKYSGEYSTRVISDIEYSDAYGEGYDYISAYCHTRNERRTFKISRIIAVDDITDVPVTPSIKRPKTAYTGNVSHESSSSGFSDNANRGIVTYSKSTYRSDYPKSSTKKSEGCYIATMAYGDYDHPQVLVLRKYRDDVLKQSVRGRMFIKLYYWLSPKLVRVLSGHEKINALIRAWLDKVIEHINSK